MLKKYREKKKIDKVRKALVLLKETKYREITSERHLYSLKYKQVNTEKNSYPDPKKNLFIKCVTGDSSDNIPRIFNRCGK